MKIRQLQELYVRVCKQRALDDIQSEILEKEWLFEYTYTNLRRIYNLSTYTISRSDWPAFMLQNAWKLSLLDEEEGVLIKGDIDQETINIFAEEALNELGE